MGGLRRSVKGSGRAVSWGAQKCSQNRECQGALTGAVAKGVKRMNRNFADFAGVIARLSGKPLTFIIACAIILGWAVSGPLFGFSDTWQLVINTGTTIVTFLMVFLIQNTQNRDGAAIQAKLDELIRTSAARNAFVGIEHLTPEEVEEIRLKCEQRAKSSHRAAHHAVRHAQSKADEAMEDVT
jgi:low affinity Fe/Cu permease